MKALTFVAVLTTVFGLSGVATAADSTKVSINATLTNIKGNVLVSQGENYKSARDGLKVSTGNRLMVMEGASVTLSYLDGCVDKFKGAKILQIAENSSCGIDIAVVTPLNQSVADTGASLGGKKEEPLVKPTTALIAAGLLVIPFISNVASEITD